MSTLITQFNYLILYNSVVNQADATTFPMEFLSSLTVNGLCT